MWGRKSSDSATVSRNTALSTISTACGRRRLFRVSPSRWGDNAADDRGTPALTRHPQFSRTAWTFTRPATNLVRAENRRKTQRRTQPEGDHPFAQANPGDLSISCAPKQPAYPSMMRSTTRRGVRSLLLAPGWSPTVWARLRRCPCLQHNRDASPGTETRRRFAVLLEGLGVSEQACSRIGVGTLGRCSRLGLDGRLGI